MRKLACIGRANSWILPLKSRPCSQKLLPAALAVAMVALAAGLPPVYGQSHSRTRDDAAPEAEFHMGRLIYTVAGAGRGFGWGPGRPWWGIDYPEAEYHFIQGLRRLTRVDSAADSRHLDLSDDEIFDYPWLFAQQVGHWQLTDEETTRLREYLRRGGFLVVDDFHGAYEWEVFSAVMRRVFPDRTITDISPDDSLLHVLYDLDQRTQIPGRRHLRRAPDGEIVAEMEGQPRWRGIHDDAGRLLVAINFNMDMGDAWQHADDPQYPEPMTALAYRFGINYLLYAMTH